MFLQIPFNAGDLRLHFPFLRLTEGINSIYVLLLSQNFFERPSNPSYVSLSFFLSFCFPCFQNNRPLKLHKRQIFSHSFLQRNSTLNIVQRSNLYNFANGLKSKTLPVRQDVASFAAVVCVCPILPPHQLMGRENRNDANKGCKSLASRNRSRLDTAHT